MSSTEANNRRLGQYLKYIVGILFLTFISGFVSLTLLEMFGYDEQDIIGFNALYVLWAICAVILHLYLLNTEPIEYPQHKETVWEARSRRAGELCSIVFMGFLYGLFSLVFIGVLLQWTLEIDITKLDKLYRLLPLSLVGWVIGLHFYYKIQGEKQMREQLDKLRRKETVYNPLPELLKRYEQEQKNNEQTKL